VIGKPRGIDNKNIKGGFMTTLHSSLTGTELHKPFNSGLDANKAASPAVNDWYYATDTYKLYYCAVAGAWLEAPLGTVYYDRGDPSTYDFSLSDFTTDGTWKTKSLATIVPVGTKAVNCRVQVEDGSVGVYVAFRKKGNTYTINVSYVSTYIASIPSHDTIVIACDANREIEYLGYATAFTGINLQVLGWWK
jgi:hypothetical protein